MAASLARGDTRLIINECQARGLLRNQCAYVLATAFHETAHTMKPVREMGGEKYLRAKKYYPYVGMGYVQLTWLDNYRRASRELGVDFVKHPKLLLEARYAAPILTVGMDEGWFTGKKLSDYITLQKSNFAEARRIVNGTDKATLIASYAREYDALLKAEGYGVEPAKPGAEPSPAPAAPATPANPKPEPAKPITHSKRFWTWLTTGGGTAVLPFVDWRVQFLIVVVVVGFAIYAIATMPKVREKLGLS